MTLFIIKYGLNSDDSNNILHSILCLTAYADIRLPVRLAAAGMLAHSAIARWK
jgi:hypothetical protein